MRPISICVTNPKGGAGKSTTCFHLSGFFAKAGMRVLLVDADPQASLSQAFFGSAEIESLNPSATLAGIFDDELCVPGAELPIATPYEGIWMIRSNLRLVPHNLPAPENSGLKQYVIRNLLDEMSDYDIVLIDCPPNLYLTAWSSIIAASHVLVPVPPEDFSVQTLHVVDTAIQNARVLNPNLALLGYLVTRANSRLLVHQFFEQKLRKLYGNDILRTVLSELSAYKVALACRQPVSYFKRRSKAGDLTLQLGHEILHQLNEKTQKRIVA